MKENDDIKFKKFLRSTAAYSRDRKILFDFINKSKNQNEKVYFNKNEITTVQSEYKIIEEEIIEENSFVEWLKLSNLKPIDRSNETKTIDKFISEKPKLKVEVNENDLNNDKADNLSNQAGYMTETLAKLYLNQKNYEKAIQSYKILILKFPEKNSYFADQIKKIKSLKNEFLFNISYSYSYSCIPSGCCNYGTKPKRWWIIIIIWWRWYSTIRWSEANN